MLVPLYGYRGWELGVQINYENKADKQFAQYFRFISGSSACGFSHVFFSATFQQNYSKHFKFISKRFKVWSPYEGKIHVIFCTAPWCYNLKTPFTENKNKMEIGWKVAEGLTGQIGYTLRLVDVSAWVCWKALLGMEERLRPREQLQTFRCSRAS